MMSKVYFLIFAMLLSILGVVVYRIKFMKHNIVIQEVEGESAYNDRDVEIQRAVRVRGGSGTSDWYFPTSK